MIPLRKVLPVIFALTVVLSFPGWACAQFFEIRGSSPVRVSPIALAAGDFNEDGKQDLVVASYDKTFVSVLLGNGDGTFQARVDYTVDKNPQSIAVADLDADGKLDLAIANNSRTISLLFGNGDGTFQPGRSITLGFPPTYITAGDFNGDQILDLVTDNQGNNCNCVSVLLGNGNRTFQPPIKTVPNNPPTALGVGDFNGDGKLDLATGGQFEVTIFLGNGDGTFQTGQNYAVESDPTSIAVGDFRASGKLDLAVANFQGSGVSVLLGNGDGTFQPAVTYQTNSAIAVTTGDFNSDNKLDIIAANFGISNANPAGATVFLGNGDGTFQPGTFSQAGQEDWSVAVADFNGDREPDFALPDLFGNTAIVLLNTGVVRFSPMAPISFPVQLVGSTSSPQTVTLTNTGKKTLLISSLTVQGNQFHLDGSTSCGTSVPAGGSCNIVTTFQPTGRDRSPRSCRSSMAFRKSRR